MPAFRGGRGKKRCKRRYFVGRALNADHRRAVDVECGPQCGGQVADLVDIRRRQPWKHRRQARSQTAWPEPVVAVEVVVEQPLTGHTHRVRMVVEQHECHRQPVFDRGVDFHAVHVERAVAGDHHGAPPPAECHPDARPEGVAHAAHAERDHKPAVAAHRQVVDRRGAGVAGVDDDVGAGGQRGVKHSHRLAITHPGALERRRHQVGTRNQIPTRTLVGRPCPVSARVRNASEPRKSSV